MKRNSSSSQQRLFRREFLSFILEKRKRFFAVQKDALSMEESGSERRFV